MADVATPSARAEPRGSAAYRWSPVQAVHFATALALAAAALAPAAADTRSETDAVDGARAFSYLQKQCDFGPRNPGSAGHAACLAFLTEELSALCDTVELMHFQPTDSRGNRVPPLTNVIARIAPEMDTRYLFCAHWDTRPRADRAEDPAVRAEPIIGANDGASGVAVLLELANVLQRTPPPVGVDIVLFDGEDYGEEGVLEDYLLGSRAYALRQQHAARPALGVLLDMVGDADLRLPMEQNSLRAAPDLMQHVWGVARDSGERAFLASVGPRIFDDHLPLIEIGWPVIDIIDFDYPYWHTHEDVPERCSAESLASVARVLVRVVFGPQYPAH